MSVKEVVSVYVIPAKLAEWSAGRDLEILHTIHCYWIPDLPPSVA